MRILYLNLDSDTTSRDLTEAELARVGLKAERVSAVCEDNRPLAFNKSVYKAMEMCQDDIYHEDCCDSLLLFEDDVVFDFDYKSPELNRRYFDYKMAFTPSDFMTYHLGGNIIGMDTTIWQMPTSFPGENAKLWNCWQSHATLYSAECVKYILDNFNPNVLDADNMIFDEWLRVNLLPMGRSYVMKPMIAYQRPRHSAIWNTASDYTSVHKRGNEYLKRL